jgi:hypothetical protein
LGNLETAKKVFSQGINEDTIAQYGQMTGDVKTAQDMLTKFSAYQKEQADIGKLKDEHVGTILTQAKSQNELLKNSYEKITNFMDGYDLNSKDPNEIARFNRDWGFFRNNTAKNLTNFDDKGNIMSGFPDMPEKPDVNWISGIRAKALSHDQNMADQNQQFDQYYKQQELKLKERDLNIKAQQANDKEFSTERIEKIKQSMLTDPNLKEFIKLYSTGNMNETEAMQHMPGFGGAKIGDIRMAMTAAALETNRPQYDESGNVISGFSPKKFAISRNSEKSATSTDARLQDQKVTTANSAMVLINHVVDPKTGKISNMKSITPQFASELALNAARLVSPNGQVGVELMREFKQGTLQENVSRTLGFFGLTDAGTTEANIKNIKAFVEREGKLAQQTRNLYYSGEGKNVEFNSSGLTGGTQGNPSGSVLPKPGTIEDGYRFKGGDPSNQNNWEEVR